MYIRMTNAQVEIQVLGLEGVSPADGLSLTIGRVDLGASNTLGLSSLSLDSDCYFESEGGYSLSLVVEDNGGGLGTVLLNMEDSQCAIAASSLPLHLALPPLFQ